MDYNNNNNNKNNNIGFDCPESQISLLCDMDTNGYFSGDKQRCFDEVCHFKNWCDEIAKCD